ncbi:hypothetical protein C8F01DRAFT_1243658 [Mycena amicta]|nr:hypothetical protein C8F01DRAFT_1243658 [Mycena amicta]
MTGPIEIRSVKQWNESLRGATAAGMTVLHVSFLSTLDRIPPVPPLPEAAEAEKVAGNALYKDGKYAEAIEKYTAAIAIANTSAALYGNRSIAYLKSTPPDLDLALADAQKATELEPKWGKGWIRLGEALQSLGKDEEAVKTFEQAAELSQGLAQTEAKKKLQAVKDKLGWH